jgi:hypothetical protein
VEQAERARVLEVLTEAGAEVLVGVPRGRAHAGGAAAAVPRSPRAVEALGQVDPVTGQHVTNALALGEHRAVGGERGVEERDLLRLQRADLALEGVEPRFVARVGAVNAGRKTSNARRNVRALSSGTEPPIGSGCVVTPPSVGSSGASTPRSRFVSDPVLTYAPLAEGQT